MKSVLTDRTLWYDGSVEVDPDTLEHLFLLGVPIDKITVTHLTQEVTDFNVLANQKIGIKNECAALSHTWLIPQKYADIDIDKYVCDLKTTVINETDSDRRLVRIDNELQEFKRRNLIMLLKTIIYVTDTLREKKILWGVGRGSSCASYLLYLTGLHCVDPVKYNIPMNEFLHD